MEGHLEFTLTVPLKLFSVNEKVARKSRRGGGALINSRKLYDCHKKVIYIYKQDEKQIIANSRQR